MPRQFPIVDAHHHVWDLAVRAQPWLDTSPALARLRKTFLLADLIPQAATAGVTATVVVQTVHEPAETRDLLALAVAGQLVAGVVGWINLGAPDVADAIGRLRALPGGRFLTGIRHPLLTETDPQWLDRVEIRRGLSALGAAGLTFDLVMRPEQLPGAVRVATALPGLTFVLDHLGNVAIRPKPDPAWVSGFTALARLPNTVCKLSGIFSNPAPPRDSRDRDVDPVAQLRPYLHLALDAFGPDRLMFGSDWPVSTLGASYGEVVRSAVALITELSDAERAAILGGTARAVYQLGSR
jgi:L-fuconolactonase